MPERPVALWHNLAMNIGESAIYVAEEISEFIHEFSGFPYNHLQPSVWVCVCGCVYVSVGKTLLAFCLSIKQTLPI